MAWKWSPRLIATGALALALGCRSHPVVPVCTTPLYPEDVVRLTPAGRPSDIPGPMTQLVEQPVATPSAPPPSPAAEPPPVVAPKDVSATLTSMPKPEAPEPVLRLPDPDPVPAGPAMPLKPGEKFGHGSDYRWVAGKLDRHLKGGHWTLRYADIGDDDPWGGKVRLLNNERLKDLRDGDVVYVEGDLLAPAGAADITGYPTYRVKSLTLVEKAP
jgi:hypothetical protein